MIRHAVEADIPRLVIVAERHHRASHWHGIVEFAQSSAAKSIRAFIEADSVCALVAEEKGEIVAFLAVISVPLYFNAKAQSTQELCWYSESPASAFALVSAADKWAKERGADVFMIGAQENEKTERMARIYARKGFMPFSHGYLKVLSDGR